MVPALDHVIFEEMLPPGGKWSHVLKRHQGLRLTDVEGGANVSALFYNRDLLLERYNMPDTLKAQYTAFLTRGRVLFSDMGRILCSIVDDSSGWHDTVCGHSDATLVSTKYGVRRYQEHRNAYHQNALDNFLVELTKWGLGKEDLVPNVNFFSKVVADAAGALSFVPEHARQGAHVDLRAEMNVLVVLTACQHPLDPAPEYRPRPVELTVFQAGPPAPDDPCRLSRAENARGFENTERYFA
jgi:urea carboxylase-associated protein 2